ncbi:50S ribosomal protein L28 [Candidatus Peregrinibacteria bacterium HGW-Peregrinibacteria-1]|jgi:large subunit ribosomal protein L28|nr:MAG: 50S ribosomal protein L28 [Candidatus Peregrinibacteria bacterium HGW-Peregrinibacteria-1]
MSKVCKITGKKPSAGNTRSHSNRSTRRRYLPNLQVKKVRVLDEKTGKMVMKKMRVSTAGIKKLDKLMV